MSILGIGLNGYSPFSDYSGYGYTSTPEKASPAPEHVGMNRRTAGTADMQMLKRMGAIECKTCESRTYQDGSNDPGVSFKAPGRIDPASSRAVVRSHEQEHVVREQSKARSEGRRVISQSVTLSTAVCSECGRVYVSGGVTRTTTAADKNNTAVASAYKSRKVTTGQNVNQSV